MTEAAPPTPPALPARKSSASQFLPASMDDIEAVCAELAQDLEELEKDTTISQALEKGQVRDMAKQVEAELRDVEASSVRDYMQQSSQVVELHGEMQKCDGILAKMQEMLLGFDADLESVSSEIRQLQKESRRMKAKLANRKSSETLLRAFLDAFALSPTLPQTICDGDVDEHFAEAIAELDSRLIFVKKKSQEDPKFSSYAASRDVGPALDKLRLKAVSKCREYLAEKIGDVRKLDTNVEVTRTLQLCKFASLYAFVDRHAPEVAVELRDYYVDSMAKALYALFKAYNAALAKFDKEIANKHDLVCVQEASVRSQFTTKVSLSKRGDAFSLAERVDVLARWRNAPPIVAHLAQAAGDRFPFDELFRSAVRHLIDAVLNEIDFVAVFFVGVVEREEEGGRKDDGGKDDGGKDDGGESSGAATSSASEEKQEEKESSNSSKESSSSSSSQKKAAASSSTRGSSLPEKERRRRDQIVARVFGKAASAVLDHLEAKLFQCHDVVGLLLVAKIVAAAREEMRATNVLDAFFDHCDSLLKPRLATLFAANVDSARRADPAKLGVSGVMPHYVSRRYAELAASVLALFPDGRGPERDDKHGRPARAAMADLRKEVTQVLERVSRSFGKPKDATVFLVNNLDAILTILKERRGLSGRVFKVFSASREKTRSPAKNGLSSMKDGMSATSSVRGDAFGQEIILGTASSSSGRRAAKGGDDDSEAEPPNAALDAEVQFFEDRLARQRELFVEAELAACFPKLIAFVKNAEAAGDKGLDAKAVERLVRDFAATWKTAIEKVHKDVLASFANFVNGMELLKHVLTQLLLYYTRFQDLIKKHWRRQPAFAKDLVPTSAILAEIKKYSRVY